VILTRTTAFRCGVLPSQQYEKSIGYNARTLGANTIHNKYTKQCITLQLYIVYIVAITV